MNGELKLLLVGSPNSHSVWLHLLPSGILGLSAWRAGKVTLVQARAKWLAPSLWLAPTSALRIPSATLPELLDAAGKIGFDAVYRQDLNLLVKSMRTQFGCQCANGAPVPEALYPNTLSRVYSQHEATGQTFLIGLNKKPVLV